MIQVNANDKYGRLTIVKYVDNTKYVLCQCDCGRQKTIIVYDIVNGKTKSCGCIRKETTAKKNTTHGLCNHPLYNIWCHIKARCYDPKEQNYKWYGAKGIEMSNEWKNNFQQFYNDMIPTWASGLSIERISNNKNYSKDNCKWIPLNKQQANRSNNVIIQIDDEQIHLADLARKLNISAETVKDRIAKGKLIATILTK